MKSYSHPPSLGINKGVVALPVEKTIYALLNFPPIFGWRWLRILNTPQEESAL